MSFTVEKKEDFTYIHRLLNTNIDGKRTVPYALRVIRGIGKKYCKKNFFSLKFLFKNDLIFF